MMFMAKSQHRRDHMIKNEAVSIDHNKVAAIGKAKSDTSSHRWLGLVVFAGVISFLAAPMVIWIYFL